mmetsp:Transcript_81585/g.207290  ORF Transcript_81585/g.207290 Transcript_81585/m.207290 type:complete len:209 (+) Transcript_81585:292-918(+)
MSRRPSSEQQSSSGAPRSVSRKLGFAGGCCGCGRGGGGAGPDGSGGRASAGKAGRGVGSEGSSLPHASNAAPSSSAHLCKASFCRSGARLRASRSEARAFVSASARNSIAQRGSSCGTMSQLILNATREAKEAPSQEGHSPRKQQSKKYLHVPGFIGTLCARVAQSNKKLKRLLLTMQKGTAPESSNQRLLLWTVSCQARASRASRAS